MVSTSDSTSVPASNDIYQRTSLKVNVRTDLNVTEDGQVQSNSQAKLRFRYEFESGDGTTIRIRAEANMRYSEISGDDEESQSMKLRAAVRVSVLQKNVASGTAPLVDNAGSTDTKNAIAGALDMFRQATDAAASLFINSDILDGDSLISGMVEAFNGFAETIGAIFQPSSSAPAPEVPGDVIDVPPSLPDGATEPPVIEPVPGESTEPPQVDSTEPDPVDTTEPASTDLTEPAPVESEEPVPVELGEMVPDEPVDSIPAESETGEPQETGVSPSVEPTAQEPAASIAESVMLRLRLQVIRSLDSLAAVFDPAQSKSTSVLKASLDFSARYEGIASNTAGQLPEELGIDAQA